MSNTVDLLIEKAANHLAIKITYWIDWMKTDMEYRRLGKSGLKVSALSFGSWVTFSNQLKEKDALEIMSYAYDNGVNFFDNA